MNTSTNHTEHLISYYLDGELSAEQRQMMDDHLAICGECAELLARHQEVESLIATHQPSRTKHLTTQELLEHHEGTIASAWRRHAIEYHLTHCPSCRKLVNAVENLDVGAESSLVHEPPPAWSHHWRTKISEVFFGKRLLPIGVALGAVIFFIILVSQRSNPYERLVQLTPPQYLPSETRGEEDVERAFAQFKHGMVRYLSNDFAGAATLLQQAAGGDPANPQFQFFCGVTLLLDKQYDSGLDYLTKKSVLESAYRDEALWYAAQAFLKLNQPEPARNFLLTLVESSGALSARASDLLKQINAIKEK